MNMIEKIKKLLKKVFNTIFGIADINDDGKINKEDLKSLEKKTKAELEKLGRKIGIELDKRLTKAKLIKQIKKATK